MIIRINDIQYSEILIEEMQSKFPVGTSSQNMYAECDLYFNNGDKIKYYLDLSRLPELNNLIDAIKSKVKENFPGSKDNATK